MVDPLKYFRIEARELCEQLQRGLLELERSPGEVGSLPKLLRLAHTLKGAARVVKQAEVAVLAHQLEDALVPLREAGRAISAAECANALGLVDAVARRLVEMGPAPTPDAVAVSPTATVVTAANAPEPWAFAGRSGAASDFLLDVARLGEAVSEAGAQLSVARNALTNLGRARDLAARLSERLEPRRRHDSTGPALEELRALSRELRARLDAAERELTVGLEQGQRELGQVRDGVERLRLAAAASIFGSLERAARDAAVSLGKRAAFEASGGDVRLEAGVLTAVQRALVQAVRNAVAHGIESPSERNDAGKPPGGRVAVEVSRRGKQVCFTCLDDGRGVDLLQVRREAERLGRIAPAELLSEKELLRLLLAGGISTTRTVSELAGRGVGLDLIREALASVGGSVELDTEPGKGTRLELRVPTSLAALEVLLVEAAGQTYGVPLASVERALRLLPGQWVQGTDSASVRIDDQLLRFRPLALLLRHGPSTESASGHGPCVVVRGERGRVALGVDRLLGSEEVVAHALSEGVPVDPSVLGVSLDANGNPRVLLEPEGLVALAERASLLPVAYPRARRVVLVVDDSLTTRMLEQSILESAGYEVDLASSGEAGLEMARAKRYDLYLVDVEMPGIDGFTFIESVKADAATAGVPAVLVTSRASADDLARGLAVGASAHIAKGEFDQLHFLDTIGGLTR